jgi:hypothetical protein
VESQSKKTFQNIILIVIAFGIWAIVLQNAGLISTTQKVKVVNTIDADVSGNVEVDNTVDINIQEVNGHRNAFYGPNKDGSHDAIHVYTGN